MAAIASNNYVTKAQLGEALNKQTDEIVEIIRDLSDSISVQHQSLKFEARCIRGQQEVIAADLKEVKENMGNLFGLADKVIKQQEINDEERLVMAHQLERMNRWVHELADKIGVKLSS